MTIAPFRLNRPAAALNSASAQGLSFYQYSVIPAIIAVTYAAFLTLLPIDNFVDRVNYFIYARTSASIADFYNHSIISYLTNEPLWLHMNTFLYSFVSDETVIRIFIFFPALISAYFVASKRSYNVFYVAFALLSPGIIQNHIIHIRQGVAISVFLLGYFSRDTRLRYIFIGIAPFIHSAFFVVSALFFIIEAFRLATRLNPYARLFIIALSLVIIVSFLGTIMSSALIRQADEYQNVDSEFSGIGFAFWSLILLLFLTDKKDFIDNNMLSILVIIFYLMIYFFAPFAGRVLECILIPLFMGGMSLSSWKKYAFAAGIFLYSAQFYYVNSDLYWFGWGL